jgi:hypothetical protein
MAAWQNKVDRIQKLSEQEREKARRTKYFLPSV